MKYTQEQISEKLASICYTDLKKSKKYYYLKDVLKEFKIEDFDLAMRALDFVKKDLIKLTFPLRNLFKYEKDENNNLTDVLVNNAGLLFVMASLARISEKHREIGLGIAKNVQSIPHIYYPEYRMIYRKRYSEITKELRSVVKTVVIGDRMKSLHSHLSTMYSTILTTYYNVSNVDGINRIKTEDPNKNYLDYISARELKDLGYIQKQVLKAISNNPKIDFIAIAKIEAQKRRQAFYWNFANMYPHAYEAHTNEPKTMYNEFNKFLKVYNIEEKTEQEKTPTK